MKSNTFSDDDWNMIVSSFSCDLEQTALEDKALVRKRRIKDAEALLRLCLLYGYNDLPLADVAAQLRLCGLADISDVGVLKRLRHCQSWLERLLADQLDQRAEQLNQASRPNLRLCLVDASVITEPASTG